MKTKAPTFATVLFLFFSGLGGCSNGMHSRTGEFTPAATPSPMAISSSGQVVKISSSPVSIALHGSADATVKLSISPGFHINANPATFPYLIATELQPGKLGGITTDKPAYPSAVKKKFAFAEQPLAVYEGDLSINLPLRATSSAPKGNQPLPIKVRVQACDEEKCYPPATIESSIQITVN